MGSKSKSRAFLTLSLILVLPASTVGTIMLLVPSAHAASTPGVYYVSSSGSNSNNGNITRPFATISKAVANATWYYSRYATEPTVLVGPGTYNEAVVFGIPLKLMSESGQPANTVVNASGLANGIAAVNATSAGSVIEGFTVENANNHGIFVQDSSNVRVENNVASNNGLKIQIGLGEDKAIQLTGTSNSIVAGNTAVGNLYGGIGIADDGAVNPSWNVTGTAGSGIPAGSPNPGNNNLISGNSVTNNRPNHCAIVVSSYDQNEGVSNNILSGNVVVDNQNGVIIAADLPNTIAVNNTVIGNQILGNGEGGVVVHSNAAGDVVKGNSIMNNVFDSNGYLPTLEGIIVGGDDKAVPAQNTLIMGNTFEEEAIGIDVVSATNTTVGGNIFEASVTTPTNGTVTTITVSTNNSQAQTAMYISYAAIAVAVVLGGVAIYFSKKRPTPPPVIPPTAN